MFNAVDVIARAVQHYDTPVVLHSGGESHWVLDALILSPHFVNLMRELNPRYQPVGIELGGALLARSHSTWAGIVRKAGQVYVPSIPPTNFNNKVTLVDDVVTTGQSLEKAEDALRASGYEVMERVCLLDRRPEELRGVVEIRSLITVEDLSLLRR